MPTPPTFPARLSSSASPLGSTPPTRVYVHPRDVYQLQRAQIEALHSLRFFFSRRAGQLFEESREEASRGQTHPRAVQPLFFLFFFFLTRHTRWRKKEKKPSGQLTGRVCGKARGMKTPPPQKKTKEEGNVFLPHKEKEEREKTILLLPFSFLNGSADIPPSSLTQKGPDFLHTTRRRKVLHPERETYLLWTGTPTTARVHMDTTQAFSSSSSFFLLRCLALFSAVCRWAATFLELPLSLCLRGLPLSLLRRLRRLSEVSSSSLFFSSSSSGSENAEDCQDGVADQIQTPRRRDDAVCRQTKWTPNTQKSKKNDKKDQKQKKTTENTTPHTRPNNRLLPPYSEARLLSTPSRYIQIFFFSLAPPCLGWRLAFPVSSRPLSLLALQLSFFFVFPQALCYPQPGQGREAGQERGRKKEEAGTAREEEGFLHDVLVRGKLSGV